MFHLVIALSRIPVKMTAIAGVEGLEFRVDADPRLDDHLEASEIEHLAPLVLEGRSGSKMLDTQFIRLGGRIDRKLIIR